MESGSPGEDGGDDRSPFAIGYGWAARIMGIGIETIVPILLGALVDYWLGTVVLFLFLGLLLGCFVGYTQLLKIVREEDSKKK